LDCQFNFCACDADNRETTENWLSPGGGAATYAMTVAHDDAGRLLVRQMALASIRIDRAAKQEAAALANKIRHASTEFDLARLKEVDRLFESIEDCPRDYRRRLLTQPEGVDKLVDALASVRDQLKAGLYRRWQPDHLG